MSNSIKTVTANVTIEKAQELLAKIPQYYIPVDIDDCIIEIEMALQKGRIILGDLIFDNQCQQVKQSAQQLAF